jgi:hypothetical protein
VETVTIHRIAHRMDGTFGVILMAGVLPIALSLERPWNNNAVGASCIPEGQYICKRVNSPKFGNTFEVTGVPGRTLILFHKGNIDDDSHGCILVGEEFSTWTDGSASIARSGDGFTEFLRRLEDVNEFFLTVKS